MFGAMKQTPNPRPDHTACSGCSLCLLVCPVWRKSHDLTLTPHGRAKALQHGASIPDIATSIESCTLCGACGPVCPEEIDLVGMIVGLRRQLPRSAALQSLINEAIARQPVALTMARTNSRGVLLPDAALRSLAEPLAHVTALLKIAVGEDNGADIALTLETGVTVATPRLEQFLDPLRQAKCIVVADGLLLRYLRDWLPRLKIVSLGAALSRLAAVRRSLRATDLYVIEPRAYHADHDRMVQYYDRLRFDTGCAMNLDLQRIAIPATARSLPQSLGIEATDDSAQTRWLLHHRKIRRIVVESLADIAAFKQVCDLPVVPLVHIAKMADDEKMNLGALS